MTDYFERARSAMRNLLRPEGGRPEPPAEGEPPSIRWLESVASDTTLAGRRFGSMLRELHQPELLIAALRVRAALKGAVRDERKLSAALDGLQLSRDARHMVEFLVRNEARIAQIALGPDPENADAIAKFAADLNAAALFNRFTTEAHLKKLTLMTAAGLAGDGALTPLKSELLWRLFVDTYNHLTKTYGDEVIDIAAMKTTPLFTERPADISEEELVRFLDGMPKRYLTLFDPESIYEHVRLFRNITAEDVHHFLRTGEVSELTVVTLDKPFLFSNVCGVLSYLGMDILQGQALTSTHGLVLDVFRFSDPRRALTEAALEPLLSDAVAGRVNIAEQLRARPVVPRPGSERVSPLISFDHEASDQYTVLEIVARDAPGLLFRISRTLSRFACEIDMVVISTEATTAIDVFHVRKDGAKLTEADELPLTEALEQAIEGSAV